MRLPQETLQVMHDVHTSVSIKSALESEEWVLWAIQTMNELQHPEERKAKSAFIADGVGPSKFDAYPISTTCQLLDEGEALSPELIEDMRKRMGRYAGQLAIAANNRELERAYEAVGHLEGAGHALIASYRHRIEEENPTPEKKKSSKRYERDFRKVMQTDIRLLECNLYWAKRFLEKYLDECKACGKKSTLAYGKCDECRAKEAEAEGK